MEARVVGSYDFLRKNDIRYVIPIYQRDYAWKIEQCDQLFSDILEIIDKGYPHFIGSIVELCHTQSSHGIRDSHIIDGQQRLTTLFLLYLALSKLDSETEPDEYEDYLYISGRENKGLKIQSDKEQNDILIKLTRDELKRDNSNFYSNYEFFKEKLAKEPNLSSFKKALDSLRIVLISLDERDNPQEVFESLNSTGVKLVASDLIQNYILMNKTQVEQNILFGEYWQYIKENTQQGEKLSDFMRHYLATVNNKLPSVNKVYEAFKHYLPRNTHIDEVKVKLAKIKLFSQFYSKMMNPNLEEDEGIRYELTGLNQFGGTTCYPFLMQIYQDYDKGKLTRTEFIEILSLIQNYAIRRTIVNLKTSSLNTFYVGLYSILERELLRNPQVDYVTILKCHLNSRNNNLSFPRDREVESQLRLKDMYNTGNIHYLLEKLENYQNSEKVCLNKDISVEHVFPQKSDKWKNELSEEDYQYMQEHLHCLANLTYTGENSKLSNKPFKDKKEIFQHSRLWLNQFIAKQEKWTPVELRKRENLLIGRFFEVFPYPSFNESQSIDENMKNDHPRGLVRENPHNLYFTDAKTPQEILDEGIKLAGGKVKTVEFFGKPLILKSTALKHMYIEVCRMIYQKNGDPYGTFVRSSHGGRLDLHDKIETEIYVYTCLSSEAVIKNLANILKVYGWQNALKIQLKFK